MKARRSKIAIVGAGNLASALADWLSAAGFTVSEIVSRGGKTSRRRASALARRVHAHSTTIRNPEITADVVWLCVPDRVIGACAQALAKSALWKSRIAVHSSGALTSDEIAVLRSCGATVASAHPLMTFVPGATPPIECISFAVEGDAAAVRQVYNIAAGMGARTFTIKKEHKAAYHAWGTFASPLLTALLSTSERVAEAAGVSRKQARRRMLPIVRQTVENYGKYGAARGFSGPIVRGDTETVAKHLKVLRRTPEAYGVYRALAIAALHTLPVKNRSALEKLLRDSRP
jgi:predicted short-subunit dehydrogenase-like oxidoreductase (DUF2520 family)